jgi:quinoprotein dehydrogenase-associated probable ABC transporter substrate-binding protein
MKSTVSVRVGKWLIGLAVCAALPVLLAATSSLAQQGMARGAAPHGPGAMQPGLPPGAPGSRAPAQAPFEMVDPKVFRVCGDPRNLPFSDTERKGFENKIADMFAKELGKSVAYAWYPNAPGFVRNTLAVYKCDIIMGVPQGDDIVQVTNPYYHTVYTLVFLPGHGLDGVDTLSDPRLKDKHIGIVAGTPPATNMVLDGLMDKAKPYPLVIDTRYDSSAAKMMHDLTAGNIDAGVLWGPLAGYYAKNAGVPVTMVPLLKEKNGPRMTYRIGMGVRLADQNWKRQLNRLIRAKQAEINTLLLQYGVPLLDESNHLIKAASAAQ